MLGCTLRGWGARLACDRLLLTLTGVTGSVRWKQHANVQPCEPVIHIAEKFRLAYISRERRVRAKMERNWQQQRRREMRRSPAEALIRQWESEL